ncbi:nucleotide sugar dehydrogenase [Neptunomonas japonica]|uniref:UDP-glucose 6-dehydrogenase n=1 Tax=Neptunomonas japonica JAMM 1380 TaxID=1441457 RepID=A0A7R6PR47_9GAMM|nr:nucleotide sugar dehydrogenase [Neptunomonas japonica]BBB28880.1 UDP-glucose 6-dehydrogenase [Neptunomonas japonica JAMM 1380]
MKIVIWGLELTAWATAGMLAQSGNDVFIVNDTHITDPVALMGSSISNEPGLKDLINQQFDKQNLQFIQSSSAALFSTHFLSMNPAEFEHAQHTVSQIAKQGLEKVLIINQSHFGVGYTDKLQKILDIEKDQVVVYLAENISEGEALKNIRKPTSLTLGSTSEWASMMTRSLLRPFSSQLEQLLVMTPKEAEFAKLSITGMLALRIGYINELANLAEQLDVDIEVIKQSLGADPRIGHHYLAPGCGFGGNTFSQTIKGLANLLSEKRQSQLLDTVLEENEKQKEQPFRKLWRHYECDIHNLNIAIWGVSFKPGSAALDSAPSLKIISALTAQQASVHIHDPEALENIEKLYGEHPQVHTYRDKYAALNNADALLLLTEWPEYASPDCEEMKERMLTPLIIDGRNLFSKELLESLGFTYYGIGR